MYHRDQLDVGKYTIHACYWVTVILYPNAPPNGIFAYIWPKVMVKCIGKSFIHGASGVVRGQFFSLKKNCKISGTPTHGARHDVASPGCQVRTNSVRGPWWCLRSVGCLKLPSNGRKLTWIPKMMPYLKGGIHLKSQGYIGKKSSCLISMLIFGGVHPGNESISHRRTRKIFWKVPTGRGYASSLEGTFYIVYYSIYLSLYIYI